LSVSDSALHVSAAAAAVGNINTLQSQQADELATCLLQGPDGLACAVQCTGQHKKLTFNLQSGFTRALLYCSLPYTAGYINLTHQQTSPLTSQSVQHCCRTQLCACSQVPGRPNWPPPPVPGCVAILHSHVGAATSYRTGGRNLPPTLAAHLQASHNVLSGSSTTASACSCVGVLP
jgi:hypothetical protein